MEGIRSKVDPDAVKARAVDTPYPHFYIKDMNKCVPLVINALEDGDFPLLGTHKGTTKIVKHISKSAYNIQKLLRVTTIEFVKSETDTVKVDSILDYMEVAQQWI